MKLKYKKGDRVVYKYEYFNLDLFTMKSSATKIGHQIAQIIGFPDPDYTLRTGCQYYAKHIDKRTDQCRGMEFGLKEENIERRVT